MTPAAVIRDRERIAEVLGRRPDVHPYGLGDLEEPYWSRSTWWRHGEAVVGVVDLDGRGSTNVYAVTADDQVATTELLVGLADRLPARTGLHGPPGATAALVARAGVLATGPARPHLKMYLADPGRLRPGDPGVLALGPADAAELGAFLAVSADPGHWFDPSLLLAGPHVGVRDGDGRLVAAAGVHLCAPSRGVAAVANVATDPGRRGRGLGTRVVSALCRRLLELVPVVGLNVGAENDAAIGLYERLGFVAVADYEEAEIARPAAPS